MPEPQVRQRGKVNAYSSGFLGRNAEPEFTPEDGTWTRVPNGYAKNVFRGNTLYQNLVTDGEYGVPRRSVRIIENFDLPARADTSYIDALGDLRPKHQTLFQNTHSAKFMGSVDAALRGMEPIQINEREVKGR